MLETYVSQIRQSLIELETLQPEIPEPSVAAFTPRPKNPKPDYPIPQSYPCRIEDIPGSANEIKVYISGQTVRQLFEEKKSFIIFYLLRSKLVNSSVEAIDLFESFIQSKERQYPKDIPILKEYFSDSTLPLLQDLNPFKKISIKDTRSIVKNFISPTLIESKELYPFYIDS